MAHSTMQDAHADGLAVVPGLGGLVASAVQRREAVVGLGQPGLSLQGALEGLDVLLLGEGGVLLQGAGAVLL